MSIENIIENQQFKTTSALVVLFCLLIGGLYVLPISLGKHHLDLEVKAKVRAEILSYQILQIYRDHQKNQLSPPGVGPQVNLGGRGLASVEVIAESQDFRLEGTMGIDPWGEPYHYKIVRTQGFESIGKSQIVVKSSGINGRGLEQLDPITFVLEFKEVM